MTANREQTVASIVFAAGKGSRMKGFEGNKTLLPLLPGDSPFEGAHPILIHILDRLPGGPKALVVHHRKEEVIEATKPYGPVCFEETALNGTGGALLAARPFVEREDIDHLIITMGDVPFVQYATYQELLTALTSHSLVALGFQPQDKKQYGVLETERNRVKSIVEWKYWSTFSTERQDRLKICNSGIYAVRREVVVPYLAVLEKNPHTVLKERDGKMTEIKEYFITDLVQMMHEDGLSIGYVVVKDEFEVMGIDDLPSLIMAQEIFSKEKEGVF
jgi:bifunctional UDP-N-acetylglucosamine pyrophosphorylase/glucosamine-1-phosphate N-acetyltransferase